MPEEKFSTKRSSLIRVGTQRVIEKTLQEYRLPEILEHYFEKDLGFFLDIASYSIITENNAGQYYPDCAYNHSLFSEGMKVYSDSKISDFLYIISSDQSAGFLNEWNGCRDYREKIYISYDSTNKNCQVGDLELAVFLNDMVLKHKGTFENKRTKNINSYNVYGTLTTNEEGDILSFTEMEFDYAIKSRKPVLVFEYKNIENLPQLK
ncbi:MAG: hypothetical protein PHE02_05950 [Lachnospiraceae bacterium]|nr:hypothetical protein [Lachnospiraceae bacterium]